MKSIEAVSPIVGMIWLGIIKGKEYRDELGRNIDPEIVNLYQPLIRFGSKLTEIAKKIPAVDVAMQITRVLRSNKPKPVYIVGRDAKGAAKAAKLPKKLLDWIIRKRIQEVSKMN